MKKLIIITGLTIMFGCVTQKKVSSSKEAIGDTRTIEVEFLDNNTYLLDKAAVDITYGYDKLNPIKVGGVKDSNGPRNQRRFFNALQGPNGEDISFFRVGSCCSFNTPNGLFDNSGMLDKYSVTWTGASDTLMIYVNMYDTGDLFIPIGLTAKKKN